MTRHTSCIAMIFMIAVFALASAAMAQSYSGDWQATVSHSQRSNGTYCISLTDNGSYGPPHSGVAKLIPNNGEDSGYFSVIDGIITVSFSYPSGEGDCCSYQVFTAKASDGQIGSGVYNYMGITDIGVLTFGKKGSCSE